MKLLGYTSCRVHKMTKKMRLGQNITWNINRLPFPEYDVRVISSTSFSPLVD